jgi:uncharacterized membrane protein YbhN (UPF0104 family)
VLYLGGFILFTDTHSTAYRVGAGLVHGIFHLLGVFVSVWVSSLFVFSLFNLPHETALSALACGGVVFVFGGLLGSFLMGAYLLISLNYFGRHHNEAFSALKIEDYKNFIRMKIDNLGNLAIYPVGITKPHKSWRRTKLHSHILLEPDGGCAETVPCLIEKPISYGTAEATEPKTPIVNTRLLAVKL